MLDEWNGVLICKNDYYEEYILVVLESSLEVDFVYKGCLYVWFLVEVIKFYYYYILFFRLG